MSDPYLWLKAIHIGSAIVLFGTGLGTAFQMWLAHRSGDVHAIAVVARNTVLADWLFTLPSGIVQPVTGLAMVLLAGFDPHAGWLMAAYGLYFLAFACWVPVVVLQIRMRDLAMDASKTNTVLPPEYFRAARLWYLLGWPSFIAMATITALMVMKPEI